MKVDWSPLNTELALWRRAGLTLPLWWRDDDAIAATPALERLSALSEAVGLPVHIAVIPDRLTPTLAPFMSVRPNMVPVVHGWRHVSHAPEGAKNAEFGHPRATAKAEMQQGLARLSAAFGPRLCRMFVPPWNRIARDLMPDLAQSGYDSLSTFGARSAPFAAPELAVINTHIDPIFWRGHRGLVAPEELVAGTVKTLQAQRSGRADSTEPLGLLTHHLVHTEDVWQFSGDVISALLDGGATPARIP